MNTIKDNTITNNRQNIQKQLATQEFDLVVIGGGITGAGIALDAASRGLSVALVDKQDFGAGTSSRSTKLIHGGLRYLKQLEVKLVMEVGREREIVYRNAPHIVIPEKMLLPLVKDGTYGNLATSVGLWVYDKLAGVKETEQRLMLDKEATASLEPLLRTDILEGGGLYIEYRTDDARLTIEVVKTAIEYGAVCLNYAQVEGFNYTDKEKVCGLWLTDLKTGEKIEVQTKRIVNATGPWVDEIRQKDKGKAKEKKRLHLTKGCHVVVPYERLPLKQSVYFDVPGGRMMFAIPRGTSTYIGTTDTNYHEKIESPQTSLEDVNYILKSVNAMFPTIQLEINDITSSWAGLRPLIHEEGKSPSELSRKDEIFVSSSGLISIAGGKLTGYRKMAQRIVDKVIRSLNKKYDFPLKECVTENIVLTGGRFDKPEGVKDYIYENIEDAYNKGLNKKVLEYLVYNYGTNTPLIVDKICEIMQTETDKEIAIVKGELWYCVNYELCTNLSDFFTRRTGRLYFRRKTIDKLIAPISADLQKYFNLSSQQIATMAQEFKQEYEEAVSFL
jgi:glycerol-3-phosphate dehydrogenase